MLRILFLLISIVVTCTLGQIRVDVNFQNVTHTRSPNLFGMFFEEINHAGEGGLYAELIQNRGFEAEAPSSIGNTARTVSLESAAYLGSYVRHCFYTAYTTVINSQVDRQDSTFSMDNGLAGSSTTSFQSINYPGYYLRHFNFRLTLSKNDGSAQFAQDSSFRVVAGLADPSMSSFEALNFPGYYIAVNGTNDGPCTTIQDKRSVFLINKPAAVGATFKVTAGFGPLFPWDALDNDITTALDNSNPLNSKSNNAAKLTATKANTGVYNSGYWGINVQPGSYLNSLYVRADDTFIKNAGQLVITLESQDGKNVYAKASIGAISSAWQHKTSTLTVAGTIHDTNARFVIRLSAAGTIWLDVVSLFPSITYKNRPNGLRPDLVKLMADVGPKFLRFPGGNFVEGYDAKSAFLWKNTIGPIEARPGHMGVWGYFSTDGLGLMEYLLLCEDLKMDPIWVVSVGIFLGDGSIPLNEIEPWIQDALDSIEYISGPANSTWGRVRAQNGHPEPFNLKIVALGNENGCGFDRNKIYTSYYNTFALRIRAVYPHLRFIANCDISDTTRNVDIFDFHVYSSPQWFLENANLFDRQNRKGPTVFVSEYAVTEQSGKGNLQAAVAEAAFMTGLVRNSDIVELASYAPLFVNVNDRAWNPDIIQFDNHAVAPTPSYYVQLLFTRYTGDKVLSYTVSNANISFAASATFDSVNKLIYIPVVNYSPAVNSVEINLSGATPKSNGLVYTVTSGNPLDENTLQNPNKVIITKVNLATSSKFSFKMSPYSVNMIQIPN